MDEMRIKLSSRFMRGIVSKLIAKTLKKKLGYDVHIQLNDLDVSVIDGETKIAVNAEVKLDSAEFTKIVKDIGM